MLYVIAIAKGISDSPNKPTINNPFECIFDPYPVKITPMNNTTMQTIDAHHDLIDGICTVLSDGPAVVT